MVRFLRPIIASSVLSIFLLSGCICKIAAQSVVVDQANDSFIPNLFDSIPLISPIGQEFKPTLNSLTFVELFTQDFGSFCTVAGCSEGAPTLLVNIRAGTITGQILGTSSPLTISAGFSGFFGVTHFAFSAPVALVPGNLYVIEVLHVSGDNWAVGSGPSYPNGDVILGGSRFASMGMWFREGTTSVYKAFVQPPINADGSSLFSATRGVVPVKFRLTQDDQSTCTLPPATIAVTRTIGEKPGNIVLPPAYINSNFGITGCQYHYNLAASSLGVGTYRVDISINGIAVGDAVFVLK